jgi:hypothetical protein
MNPAPAQTLKARTVTLKPSGAPSRAGSSDREYWVLAMQMGRPPKPRSKSPLACFSAAGVRITPAPPYTRPTMALSLYWMEVLSS